MKFDGGKLRGYREAKNLSRAGLVKQLILMERDLSTETLRQWEVSGHYQPRAEDLAALADILDVELDDFFSPEPCTDAATVQGDAA